MNLYNLSLIRKRRKRHRIALLAAGIALAAAGEILALMARYHCLGGRIGDLGMMPQFLLVFGAFFVGLANILDGR